MAVLTVTPVTRAGYNLTDALTAAGVSGDSWACNGVELLAVKNAGVSSVTVTLTYAGTFDGSSPTNKTVVVGAGKTYLIGPLPQSLYNDANQRANVTYSAVTDVTVAVFRVG